MFFFESALDALGVLEQMTRGSKDMSCFLKRESGSAYHACF